MKLEAVTASLTYADEVFKAPFLQLQLMFLLVHPKITSAPCLALQLLSLQSETRDTIQYKRQQMWQQRKHERAAEMGK